jgi:hypothetical protein
VPAVVWTVAIVTPRIPSVIDMHVTCGGFGSSIVTVRPRSVAGRTAPRTRTRTLATRNAAGRLTTSGPRPGRPHTIG